MAGAAAGIIAIGSLIALTAGLPFYKLLKDDQDKHFIIEIESVSNSLEQHLDRITDIAVQITSRTKAREELQAYNDGYVILEELQEFSHPILSDALRLSSSLLGITRFDIQGNPAVQAGIALPLAQISIDPSSLDKSYLLGPITTTGERVILVVAPIRDRQKNVVGADAVAFDASELVLILRELSQSKPDREVYLSQVLQNGVDVIFAYPTGADGSSHGIHNVDIFDYAIANGRLNQASMLPIDPEADGRGATAHYLFERTGWLLTFHSSTATLYNPIYRILAKYVLALIAIIAIGSIATYRLLCPLADKVMSLTRNLHSENTERKSAEQALAKRVVQQQAVAELGQFCLTSVRTQEILDRAVKVTTDTLQVEYCKVLEMLPGRDTVMLRAGVGWHDGLVGITEVPLDKDSQAGFTLQSKEPVAVEDLTTEERFSGPQLLVDHQVRSGISVIIDPTNPWGVFGAHSTEKRVFTKDDTNFVQAIANCIAEAIKRRRAEDASRASEERFRALYDENPAMFLTVNEEYRVVSINQFGAEQLGYRADEIIGESVDRLSHEHDIGLLRENLAKCLTMDQSIHRWELRKKRNDGSTIWVRETARVVAQKDKGTSILIVCEDVSEARSLSEKLSYEASHDPLTGLANRREFENRLNRLIDIARSEKAEHVLCYMDLDQFKIINDSCGHVAGDQLLCQMASLLQEGLRKGDTIARLGGDEFGLLLQHCDVGRAAEIANGLRAKVEQFRFGWKDRNFCVGISMGLVPITESSGNITNLMRNADTACYVAKDTGRNRVHVYEEDDALLAKRHGEMQWVLRINEALDENQFCLYAQPIQPVQVAVKDEIHHELLIRLRTAENSMIRPGAFLPAAERYNLGARIDKWVINALFKYFADYPALLAQLGVCSINLSGQSLADPQFLDYVLGKLQDSHIAPDRFCFEITETAAISDLANALKFIESVKEYGCRFSLDDFGTGLSSFGYLKALPVDYLKIDGIFVKDIVHDPADFAMVKSIHEIGKSLGKMTVAEFVENDEIKNALVCIGVDFVQGYGVGRPMPLDDFSAVNPYTAYASSSYR